MTYAMKGDFVIDMAMDSPWISFYYPWVLMAINGHPWIAQDIHRLLEDICGCAIDLLGLSIDAFVSSMDIHAL